MTTQADARGSSLLESVCGVAILIPLFLIVADIAVLAVAQKWNYDACIFAARSASVGTPDVVEKGAPKKRALDALLKFNYPKSLMKIQPNILVTEAVKPLKDADVFGGQIEGTVTVQTRADIYPPFILPTFLRRKFITLDASQTFPYTSAISPQVREMPPHN